MNPNTLTLPVFRYARDGYITREIYRRVPALVNDDQEQNDWQVTFKQGLFNISSDSGYFRTQQQLETLGLRLDGNTFVNEETSVWLPLYEDWMIYQFDHRYNSDGSEHLTVQEHQNPHVQPVPRYWVEKTRVARACYELLSLSAIDRSKNLREASCFSQPLTRQIR